MFGDDCSQVWLRQRGLTIIGVYDTKEAAEQFATEGEFLQRRRVRTFETCERWFCSDPVTREDQHECPCCLADNNTANLGNGAECNNGKPVWMGWPDALQGRASGFMGYVYDGDDYCVEHPPPEDMDPDTTDELGHTVAAVFEGDVEWGDFFCSVCGNAEL